jgi:hypothetical protein
VASGLSPEDRQLVEAEARANAQDIPRSIAERTRRLALPPPRRASCARRRRTRDVPPRSGGRGPGRDPAPVTLGVRLRVRDATVDLVARTARRGRTSSARRAGDRRCRAMRSDDRPGRGPRCLHDPRRTILRRLLDTGCR